VPLAAQEEGPSDLAKRKKRHDTLRNSAEQLKSLKRHVSPTVANYVVRNDGTSVDAFLADLTVKLAGTTFSIEVGGLSGDIKKRNHRSFTLLDLENAPQFEPLEKTYWVRLRTDKNEWEFGQLLPNDLWAGGYDHKRALDIYEKASRQARARLEPAIRRHRGRFGVWVSEGKSCYVTIAAALPVNCLDVIMHCDCGLTQWGMRYRAEVAAAANQLVPSGRFSDDAIYFDILGRVSLFRDAENIVRTRYGLSKVGEAFIN